MVSSDFELPSPGEKTTQKFIFDAMRKSHRPLEESEPTVESVVEAKELAPAPAEVEAAPEQLPMPEAALGDALEAPTETPTSVNYQSLSLPEGKNYFRIGETACLIGVEPYVLRYWESEFAMVRPEKSRSGQRVYSRADVQKLHYIRHLLHVEKFSLKGAKKKLLERRKENQTAQRTPEKQHLDAQLRDILHDVKELIQVARLDPGNL